jgi:hypothetical protein
MKTAGIANNNKPVNLTATSKQYNNIKISHFLKARVKRKNTILKGTLQVPVNNLNNRLRVLFPKLK